MATTDPAEPSVPVNPLDIVDSINPIGSVNPIDSVDSAQPTHPEDSGNTGDSDVVSPVDTGGHIEAAPSLAQLGLENNEGVVVLLKEISESLRGLKEYSSRLIKLYDLSEAEEQYERTQERRENWLQDSSRDRRAGQDREPRRSAHARKLKPRNVRSTSYYSYSDSDSDSRSKRVAGEAVEIRATTNSRERSRPTDSDNRVIIIEDYIIPANQRNNSRSRRRSEVISEAERRSNAERQDRRRLRASSNIVVAEEHTVRASLRKSPRLRRGEEVRTNVARLRAYRNSSESSESVPSNDESVDIEEEERSEANSRRSTRSTNSNNPDRLFLKGYNSKTVEYGEFPHLHLCEQLFGGTGGLREGDNDEYYPWLKERGVIFAHDERCSFTFDLANLTGHYSVSGVQSAIEMVERFAHNLREKGGFFFFRESYMPDTGYRNKIYNGTHVIRCKDNRRHALPRLSREGGTFSGEFPEVIPRRKMEYVNEAVQQMIDEAQLRALREDVIGVSNRSDVLSDLLSLNSNHGPLEPGVTYHYKGEPKTDYTKGPPTGFITTGGPGPDIIDRESREVYQDPHITAPWRRLWYAGDLVSLYMQNC